MRAESALPLLGVLKHLAIAVLRSVQRARGSVGNTAILCDVSLSAASAHEIGGHGGSGHT